jgi:hypothetical protein
LRKRIALAQDLTDKVLNISHCQSMVYQIPGLDLKVRIIEGHLLSLSIDFDADSPSFLANIARHALLTRREIPFKLQEKGYRDCVVAVGEIQKNESLGAFLLQTSEVCSDLLFHQKLLFSVGPSSPRPENLELQFLFDFDKATTLDSLEEVEAQTMVPNAKLLEIQYRRYLARRSKVLVKHSDSFNSLLMF